jgi:Flp pilus assembly secretin CpaC
MSVAFERNGRSRQRSVLAVAFSVTVMIAAGSPAVAATPQSVASTDMVVVVLDQAQAIKLPDQVATLVVGNPLIADVSIQTGSIMVVTGKGYGVTNILALDRAGGVLMQKMIQVQGPRDNLVVVYRGVERESYSCTPKCERRITLGDSPAYFDAVIGQTSSRNGQAQSGAPAK